MLIGELGLMKNILVGLTIHQPISETTRLNLPLVDFPDLLNTIIVKGTLEKITV